MSGSDKMPSDISGVTNSEERDALEIREPKDLLLVGVLSPLLLLVLIIGLMILSPLIEGIVVGVSYISQDLAEYIKSVNLDGVIPRFETIFYITHLVSILSIIADSVLIGDAKLRLIASAAVLPLGSAVAILGGIGDVSPLAGLFLGMGGIGVAFVGWGAIIWYTAARKNALIRIGDES